MIGDFSIISRKMILKSIFLILICPTWVSAEVRRINSILDIDNRVSIGISVEDLKEIYPNLFPVEGGVSGETQVVYYRRAGNLVDYESQDHIAFGVDKGMVTAVYWASKSRTSKEFVGKLRKELSVSIGSSQIGGKTRLTREGITEIAAEVFRNGEGKMAVVLSSANGSTEIEIFDLINSKVDINGLYFETGKNLEKLKKQVEAQSGQVLEREESQDLLKEIIGEKREQEYQKEEEVTSKEKKNEDTVPVKEPNKARNSEEEKVEEVLPAFKEVKSQDKADDFRIPLIIGGVFIVFGLVWFFLKGKK